MYRSMPGPAQAPRLGALVVALAAALVAAADGACVEPPSVSGGRWEVAGGGRQATLLCDQGACEIDDCRSNIGVLACAGGQWTGLSVPPACAPHSA